MTLGQAETTSAEEAGEYDSLVRMGDAADGERQSEVDQSITQPGGEPEEAQEGQEEQEVEDMTGVSRA